MVDVKERRGLGTQKRVHGKRNQEKREKSKEPKERKGKTGVGRKRMKRKEDGVWRRWGEDRG